MTKVKETIYIDHINNRWEAFTYVDGNKYNTDIHCSSKAELVRLLEQQGYKVVGVSQERLDLLNKQAELLGLG